MSSESDDSISSLEFEEEEPVFGLAPYLFEPQESDHPNSAGTEQHLADLEDLEPPELAEPPERLHDIDWCTCGLCDLMPTIRESLCCQECQKLEEKVLKYNEENNTEVDCITMHPGFDVVCLNVWVLEAAYYQYRQRYGQIGGLLNERYRYVAYRQLVRWCWGWLGKKNRVVLPACAVHKIRKVFPPSLNVTGFLPALD